jgi:hypothetical protein
MLLNPKLYIQFEPDMTGPYPDLTRKDQRDVEAQFMEQIFAVVTDAQLKKWLELPNKLFVSVGGKRLELASEGESMINANMVLFFNQQLGIAETHNGEALSGHPNTPLNPICRVNRDGVHEDSNCVQLLLTVQGSRRPRPWIAEGVTVSGVLVKARIQMELRYQARSPDFVWRNRRDLEGAGVSTSRRGGTTRQSGPKAPKPKGSRRPGGARGPGRLDR